MRRDEYRRKTIYDGGMSTSGSGQIGVLCIGGANRDEVLRLRSTPSMGQSNPVTTRIADGGVARNVAQNLAALGVGVSLLCAVGDDGEGSALLAAAEAAGIDVSLSLRRPGLATGRYVAVMAPDGDLVLGLSDMAATEGVSPGEIDAAAPAMARHGAVFADANLMPETLAAVRHVTKTRDLLLAIDLVSPEKARRIADHLFPVDLLFCNCDEARDLLGSTGECLDLARSLVRAGAGAAIVGDGAAGLGWATRAESGATAARSVEVVDVTGAGDALVAGVLAARLGGAPLAEAIVAGLDAAGQVVGSEGHALSPVRPEGTS